MANEPPELGAPVAIGKLVRTYPDPVYCRPNNEARIPSPPSLRFTHLYRTLFLGFLELC